jgi:hypothetical protein
MRVGRSAGTVDDRGEQSVYLVKYEWGGGRSAGSVDDSGEQAVYLVKYE